MVAPNENGVYPKDAAECIAWPGAKGYQLYAEIYVLNVDGIWLGAYDHQLGGSDLRGGGGPLMKHTRRPDHADRQACITYEAQRLLRCMTTSDCKSAPKIREWLDSLISGPGQLDLFAEAA